MADTPILPGARVRNTEGLIGTVERLESASPAEAVPAYLIVRDQDEVRRYRLPLRLVGEIGTEGEHAVSYTVLHLDMESSELGQYVLDTEARTETDNASVVLRVPLAAEELTATSRPVLRGTIRLHKSVQIEEQLLMVPIEGEEVSVERIPADQYDASALPGPDETIIPIFEERLVVETRRVITEYVRVRKTRVVRQQEVRGPIRREVISVSDEGLTVRQRPDPRER